MDEVNLMILIFVIWMSLSFCLILVFFRLWAKARQQASAQRSSNQSLSTKYGQMTEQFMPFIDSYPWNPENFHFLGSPIDGIQFEQDEVIFVEFKTGSSKLTGRQRQIRNLIERGQVTFQEFRINWPPNIS